MPNVTPLPPRLPAEPSIWYRRFCAWLRMRPPRSVLEVCNLEREKKGKKRQDSPPGSWDGIPDLYQWKARAARWDLAEAERLNIELAQARDEWRAQEREAALLLLNKGREGLKIPLLTARLEGGREIKGDPAAVRVAGDLVSKGLDLGRRALEMATSTTRVNVSQMSDAEIIRLLDLAERGGVAGGGETAEVDAGDAARDDEAPTAIPDAA